MLSYSCVLASFMWMKPTLFYHCLNLHYIMLSTPKVTRLTVKSGWQCLMGNVWSSLFSNRRTPRFEESEDSVTEPLISQTNLNMNPSDKSTKLSTFFTSKQNIYSIYVLLLFLITYLLNQLDRYMLAIVTKPLAQASFFSLFWGEFFETYPLAFLFFFIRKFITEIKDVWPTPQPRFQPHK